MAFYNDKRPQDLTQHDLVQYLNHIKSVHGVGIDKSRMAVAAFRFFFKFTLIKPELNPSELYPRKEFKLPSIMSEAQFVKLYQSTTSIKNRAILALFYGSGMRLNELRMLKMSDIESESFQIKVVAGKGKKDRFTLLPKKLLQELRDYYLVHKPKVYLFEGQIPDQPMNDRSIQHLVRQSMQAAGFTNHDFSAHTLRHSFATHLLDNGTDIHTIKELLGHSSIETTMVYFHLQQSKRAALVSPFDNLMQKLCKQ